MTTKATEATKKAKTAKITKKTRILKPTHKRKLARLIERRRLAAGHTMKSGQRRPMGWQRYGQDVGVMSKSLFNFINHEETLGIEALRRLARYYGDDSEMLLALAEYALMMRLKGKCG